MSAQPNDTTPSRQGSGPESRGERWAKYGSNVALTVVVVIVLAILITYIAQANDRKFDTTREGANSLRPQTMNVLHDLNTDMTLVSLYSKANDVEPQEPGAPKPLNRPAMVSDLLDSYKAASSHISVEAIDPTDAAKVNALQKQLDERYGKGIKNYQDFLSQYGEASKQLISLTSGQLDRISTLTAGDNSDEATTEMRGSLRDTTLRAIQTAQSEMSKALKQERPDYGRVTDVVRSSMEAVSGEMKKFLTFAQQAKDNQKVSAPVKAYLSKNQAQLEKIQKLADDQLAKIAALPKLQVDELVRAMNVTQPILVLGPTSWRVLSEEQVWPENKTARAAADVPLQPSFAGEQQITAAIIGLTSAKTPKVALLRPGGGPLASPGFPPFQPGGPFSELADQLRMYNFDVVEKDATGTYAMQAMQQGQMAQPEPSWQDIQDAVWIIVDLGTPVQGQENVGLRLAEHLGHGGSVVLLTQPGQGGGVEAAGSDSYEAAVKDWGVDLHPDLLAVHDQPPPAPSTNIDQMQDVFRRPFIFDVHTYGEAALAKPLNNLEGLIYDVAPITTHEVPGHTVQKLLPLPTLPDAPRSWGMKGFQQFFTTGTPPKFDPGKDMTGPLYAGACSQKQGGGRLVVIGSFRFALNDVLEISDPTIEREQDKLVSRFPGNLELATNSVFWCAKMDQMLALSPAALQVSRISNMSPAALNFWRVGLLLILLPGAVLVSGVGMYYSRRD